MKIKYFALWGCILILCACNGPALTPLAESTSTPTPVPTSTFTPSPIPLTEAQQYLSDAIDIIEANALNSNQVDWDKVRSTALMSVKDAKSPADTYNAIKYVLDELGDSHSYFKPPDAVENVSDPTTAYTAPTGKLLEEKLGYVALFGFESTNQDVMNEYADKIQNIIIDLSGQAVCGWVVDLRYNAGGNMWPMIAGLGALIGEGKLGAFKNANGQTFNWFYHDGQSWIDDVPKAKVSHPEFILNPDETPVAVLIGSQTGSSGESTAISFHGRSNTQFFGKPSHGLTTSNQPYMLGDGAVIVLATGIDVDRNGQEYGGSIEPDVVTSNPEEDAVNWLLAQPACTK